MGAERGPAAWGGAQAHGQGGSPARGNRLREPACGPRPLLAAEAERDRLAGMVAEFEQGVAVLQLLLDSLETAESEAKNRYLAPVISRVEPYLKMLLPGADIVLDENRHIAGIRRDGQREEFESLSGGTQEQLAVLTRLAFAELLLGQGRPAAVILDDALAFSDDDRIEKSSNHSLLFGDAFAPAPSLLYIRSA